MTLIELADYTQLKHKVVRSANSCEQFNQILCLVKEMFRDDINSPRRYETITTIGELIKVLEIRAVLSPTDVSPLVKIAQNLPDSSDLLRAINEYETSSVIPTHLISYSGSSEKSPSIAVRETPDNIQMNNKSKSSMSAQKKQRIIDAIVEDIGAHWKNLARGLDIKERVIDELNEKYKEVNLKAKYIIELYNQKADDDDETWFFTLCEALETCRRKELVRKIRNIKVKNI